MNEPPSPTGLRYSPAPDHVDDLHAVATTSDPLGVLSAYLDFAEAGQHRAVARAERAVRSLADSPPPSMPRTTWRALIDVAVGELCGLALRAPDAGERARAVFVSLRDGTGVDVPLAVSTPNVVAIAEHPYVRVLLDAAPPSRPVAVVRTSRSGIVLKELFGDSVRAQWTLPFPQGRASEPATEGPGRSPAEPEPGGPVQGDLIRNRRAEHIHAAMADAVESIAAMAGRRTWRAVVVWGNAEDGPELAERLRARGVDPCLLASDVDAHSEIQRAQAAVEEAERLDAVQEARELVAQADSGRAALGADAVRRALDERRVARILLGAPEEDPGATTSDSPLLTLGADPAENPLETIAWTALSHQIPVTTAPGGAGRLIPPPRVGAFLHEHETEENNADIR